MRIDLYVHTGDDIAASLARLEKGQQKMANNIQDLEAQITRLAADVKRIAAADQAILDKLAASGSVPQADIDALAAANDQLEAAAAAAEAAVKPATPPATQPLTNP